VHAEGLGEAYRSAPQHPCPPQGCGGGPRSRKQGGHNPERDRTADRSPLPPAGQAAVMTATAALANAMTRHIARDEGLQQ
jgi:hypothetical protein